MPAFTFATDTLFRWHDVIYKVTRQLPDAQLNIEAVVSGEVMTIQQCQLEEALFSGQLAFVGEIQAKADRANPAMSYPYPTLDDCPSELRAVAEYRFWVIEPMLLLGKKRKRSDVERHVQRVRQMLQDETIPAQTWSHLQGVRLSVSVMSVYRWLKAYSDSGQDMRALVPASKQQGGKDKGRMALEVEAVMKQTIEEMALKRERHTVDDVYGEIFLRIRETNEASIQPVAPPSRSTVARRIEQLSFKERFEARHGRRAAYYELTQFEQMSYPQQPLVCVEIDHTRIDLIVTDDETRHPLGRPTLTVCMDAATRYPLGYYLGFEPPGYRAVMECLYFAFLPKDNVKEMYGTQHDWLAYGIPRYLVIDNGKEFIGHDLEDACNQLGIILQYTPGRTPHLKPMIERYFRTINTGILHQLPGTTFANVKERGDYDSVQQAKLTLRELDKIIHIFLLDVYAERYHHGLEGVPARRWERFLRDGFQPRLPASASELSIVLGRVAYRTIQRYGIELFSLRYNHDDLALLRSRLKKCQPGEPVKVKYHPGDLSCIHVYDPFEQRYLPVPAKAQAYTEGLTLWQHKVIRNYVLKQRDEVDIAAIAQAKRDIQQIVAEAKQAAKVSTNARVARWESGGQSATQMNRHGVEPATETATSGETILRNQSASLSTTHSLPAVQLTFDPAELEQRGWRSEDMTLDDDEAEI